MTQLKELAGDLVFEISVPPTAAGTAIEVPGLIAPFNMVFTGVKWVPGAAITANGTNFFTLTPRNRAASGSGTVVPATARSYAATNSVANVAETLALSSTASDLLVSAGDVLTAHVTHTASGLAVPAGLLQLYLRAR